MRSDDIEHDATGPKTFYFLQYDASTVGGQIISHMSKLYIAENMTLCFVLFTDGQLKFFRYTCIEYIWVYK